MSFESLGLAPELLRAIADQGYTQPTPIQSKGIPAVLTGRDLLAAAQTGTGKTAAFTLPILHRLTERTAHAPRVLVLVPTRELATQVAESVKTYSRHLQIRTAIIFGGVGFNPQAATLRRGVDIVVATPGRLLDHASQRTIDLSGIEILTLDEADRMLDMGFVHDIKRVIALLPKKRQNLMFSATFNPDIRKLATGLLHNPLSVEVAPPNSTAERVEQCVYHVGKSDKRWLLAHLVKQGDWRQVLVFTRTKHGANRLAQQLERSGVQATAIHGNKSQNARTRALADFKSGQVRVLVATDIAARGIDIDQLPHVVNYELPNVPEDYVHRIGRTGRAGKEGEAISLVSADERDNLRSIQRLLKMEIPVASAPEFHSESEPEEVRTQERPQRSKPGHGTGANLAPGTAHKRRRRGGGAKSHSATANPQGGRSHAGAPKSGQEGANSSEHGKPPGSNRRRGSSANQGTPPRKGSSATGNAGGQGVRNRGSAGRGRRKGG